MTSNMLIPNQPRFSRLQLISDHHLVATSINIPRKQHVAQQILPHPQPPSHMALQQKHPIPKTTQKANRYQKYCKICFRSLRRCIWQSTLQHHCEIRILFLKYIWNYRQGGASSWKLEKGWCRSFCWWWNNPHRLHYFQLNCTIIQTKEPCVHPESKDRKKKELYGDSLFVFAIEVCGGFSQVSERNQENLQTFRSWRMIGKKNDQNSLPEQIFFFSMRAF